MRFWFRVILILEELTLLVRMEVMRGGSFSDINGGPADIFLQFGYPELKWLAVTFVFLASIFLISSIFSLGRTEGRNKFVWVGIVSTWGLFFLAIARGGQGLWEVYQIAENLLLLQQQTDEEIVKGYNTYVRSTYWILDTAGGFFILGILSYIGTHALVLFTRPKEQQGESKS